MDLYDRLTDGRKRFVRVDDLCRRAALHSEAALEAEARLPLKEKKGLEKAQGQFLSEVLADPAAGAHLCHAMLLPLAASAARLSEYEKTGRLDLPGAELRRVGKASMLTMRNPRYLNAEDETTLEGLESAIDVATLDRQTEICVLRGGPVEHAKYAGKRLFGAGINLTHLYQGKIRYLWNIVPDPGLGNKMY